MARRAIAFLTAVTTSTAALLGAASTIPASAAAAPSCASVPIRVVDLFLRIDARFVTPHRVSASALICSYYGATGRAANEATIIYLVSNQHEFIGNKEKAAARHVLRTVSATEYGYASGSDEYLFVLDGSHQVQVFAMVPFGRLERLARHLPSFS